MLENIGKLMKSYSLPGSVLRDGRILILAALIPAPSPVSGQIPQRDKIIDTVRCIDRKEQSYALYLPPQYEPSKKWPAILIFDPSARGRLAVDLFCTAGRKFGYIIACSNNSRNGPLADNFTAAASMLNDLKGRFKLDPERIFAAGFSGGARFAMALASVGQGIAGVIGCGAGLPNDNTLLPPAKSDFIYYGIAGTRDMNYLEMHELPGYLSGHTKITPFIRFFNGGHQWPGTFLITDAVEWITFQQMNRKIIPADQVLLDEIMKKTQSMVNTELSAGNLVDAVMYMRYAARDFRGSSLAGSMLKRLSETERYDSYSKALGEWNKRASDEQEQREKFINCLSPVQYSGRLPDSSLKWLKNVALTLVRLKDKGSNEASEEASRLLNFVSILFYEQGMSVYKNKMYSQAAELFRICTLTDSDNPMNYLNLARAEAGSGNLSGATDAMTSAINHGFNSRKSVESDPVFDRLREDNRFKSLMLKLSF